MDIQYNKKTDSFWIETRHRTYIIGLADGLYPGHVYFGPRLSHDSRDSLDIGEILRLRDVPFSPAVNPGEKVSFFDRFPWEYACGGVGDYRESAIELTDANGFTGCEFQYASHEIVRQKPSLNGLPATFDADGNSMTLVLHLTDDVLNAELLLLYSIFEDSDVILRSAELINHADTPIFIEKMYSAGMDMDDEGFEMMTLYGSWARERHIDRHRLRHGRQYAASTRGISSQQAQPFLALVTPHTTQSQGDLYAMHLIYSGNHTSLAERDTFEQVRMCIGISGEKFRWRLDPGESFQTPEAAVLFSDEGVDGMTHQLHDLYRNHLIRSPWLHRDRPVLINNWEATYFDFDEEKLLSIARAAADCGIEMLVMDDGWFGHRDADDSSLGDWTVYEKKLPGGLKSLADKVNALGLKFGLWMEPEMISEDSDLFREHPDYVLRIPGREPSQSRHQYVLDLSRPEVVDCVWKKIEAVLSFASIDYIKWDMNRPLADLGSAVTRGDRAGELAHRYILGVYELQERLIRRFPDLLLENCAAGGSRFDPGMLYYSPQIWCSDDTDAQERLIIQEGTAMLYPLSAIGAHVSICPNHIVGRTTPWCMRGQVALAGTFGYELDITSLTDSEKETIREQIRTQKRFSRLIREGTYYRISSFSENRTHDCVQIVSQDCRESLLLYVQAQAVANGRSHRLRLTGLCPEAVYEVTTETAGREFGEEDSMTTVSRTGDELMKIGISIPSLPGDGRTIRIHLRQK